MATPLRTNPVNPVVVWEPRSAPQAALLACPVFEVFFGGARGSLKTDGVLGEWAAHADEWRENANGLMVRRTRTELVDTIERSRRIYGPIGGKFHEQDKLWRMPGGGRLRFAYLESDVDAAVYQGHSYTRVYVEEIGNFPSPAPIYKLMATLRSPAGVPVGFRATGNPGGPGHQWVKARYIDPAPRGWHIIEQAFTNPFTGAIETKQRVFIPGRITDHNLLGNDYVASLQMAGSEQLVRAWLLGDWDVVEGAYFDCWRADKHVIAPFSIPAHWLRFMAMDWGSAAPFSIGWWAISDGDVLTDGRQYPTGAMIRYREWYGAASPNVGLKLTAEAIADGIVERERLEPRKRDGHPDINYRVADTGLWDVDGGPSKAERMASRGVHCRRADKKRVAGWDMMRARLMGDEDTGPMLYVFSTCTDFIRTVPALQHDEAKAEDVNTDSEDHAGDECRYACMSRPWTRRAPKPPNPLERIPPEWRAHFDQRRREREDA